jgi:protoheme IX farnesyltransferase
MRKSLTQHTQNTTIKDYFLLLKPRVMSLVVFTGMVGVFLAPGSLHPLLTVLTIFFIALGSGAAGAINMWYERDVDAKMERTKNRPIPDGRIPAEDAFDFAVICAGTSVFFMGLMINMVAGALLLAAILFYVFIYTIWLKQRTPMNIVIGGAAGAFPPVIGWAAVTGSVTIEPLILFTIVFMWTPPHFWALALVKCKDYGKAGIPMLPNVAGRDVTTRQMVAYTLLLFPISISPYFIDMAGMTYLVGTSALGIIFISYALRLRYAKDDNLAMPMFRFSLLYLAGLFSLLIIDRFI